MYPVYTIVLTFITFTLLFWSDLIRKMNNRIKGKLLQNMLFILIKKYTFMYTIEISHAYKMLNTPDGIF